MITVLTVNNCNSKQNQKPFVTAWLNNVQLHRSLVLKLDFQYKMSTSSNFNFDDWIIENELDEEISAILKKEKLITVKAILGLHDDDTKELFQGYPKGYLTSFRFAKSSLATKFANSENVNSKQFVGKSLLPS